MNLKDKKILFYRWWPRPEDGPCRSDTVCWKRFSSWIDDAAMTEVLTEDGQWIIVRHDDTAVIYPGQELLRRVSALMNALDALGPESCCDCKKRCVCGHAMRFTCSDTLLHAVILRVMGNGCEWFEKEPADAVTEKG